MSTQTLPLWTAKEAADALGVNIKTLYAGMKKDGGRFNGIQIAVQINHTWKFLPEAIDRVKRGESA